MKISIQENWVENVVWKMVAILCRSQGSNEALGELHKRRGQGFCCMIAQVESILAKEQTPIDLEKNPFGHELEKFLIDSCIVMIYVTIYIYH